MAYGHFCKVPAQALFYCFQWGGCFFGYILFTSLRYHVYYERKYQGFPLAQIMGGEKRMQVGKKWGRIILLTVFLAFSICGCQQKEEVGKEEAEEVKAPVNLWEDKWTVALGSGKNISVEMKCEIDAMEHRPDSIVDVQALEISSQNKEALAKGAFGDEVYLFDVGNMCKADLQKRLSREEMVLEKGYKKLEYLRENYANVKKYGDVVNDYRKKTITELKDRVGSAKELLKIAPEEPVTVQDGEYTSDSYMGYIDGTAYRLEFIPRSHGSKAHELSDDTWWKYWDGKWDGWWQFSLKKEGIKLKRRNRVSLLTAALLLGLCGCQQKEAGNQAGTEIGKDATAVWEGQWTVTAGQGEKISVRMDCEISSSDNQPDSIVDIQPMELNGQRKEQMAKGVFGNEVYLYDWENMCEEDLKKKLAREENILEWELKELENLQEKPTKAGDAYRKQTKKELEDRVEKIKGLLKDAPKEPVKAQDGEYANDSYMGYIDDMAYRLEFNRDITEKHFDFYDEVSYEWDNSKLARTIELLSVDVEDFAPEELAGSQKLTSGNLSSNELPFNECSLSEKEAQQKAEDILEKLGFSDMIKTEVKGLAWKEMGTSYRKSVIDGYIFWFQTGAEGNIFHVLGSKLDHNLPYGREMVQVQVNDKGIEKGGV